jgi:hypothetical protein
MEKSAIFLENSSAGYIPSTPVTERHLQSHFLHRMENYFVNNVDNYGEIFDKKIT